MTRLFSIEAIHELFRFEFLNLHRKLLFATLTIVLIGTHLALLVLAVGVVLALNDLLHNRLQGKCVTGRELCHSVVLLVEDCDKYLLITDRSKFESLLQKTSPSLRQRNTPLQEVLNDVEVLRRLDSLPVLKVATLTRICDRVLLVLGDLQCHL